METKETKETKVKGKRFGASSRRCAVTGCHEYPSKKPGIRFTRCSSHVDVCARCGKATLVADNIFGQCEKCNNELQVAWTEWLENEPKREQIAPLRVAQAAALEARRTAAPH